MIVVCDLTKAYPLTIIAIVILTVDSEGSSVEKRKLIPRRPGITWNVGCKLEAMDFLKNWCVEAMMKYIIGIRDVTNIILR